MRYTAEPYVAPTLPPLNTRGSAATETFPGVLMEPTTAASSPNDENFDVLKAAGIV